MWYKAHKWRHTLIGVYVIVADMLKKKPLARSRLRRKRWTYVFTTLSTYQSYLKATNYIVMIVFFSLHRQNINDSNSFSQKLSTLFLLPLFENEIAHNSTLQCWDIRESDRYTKTKVNLLPDSFWWTCSEFFN